MNFEKIDKNLIIIVVITIIICYYLCACCEKNIEKFDNVQCNNTDERYKRICIVMNTVGQIKDNFTDSNQTLPDADQALIDDLYTYAQSRLETGINKTVYRGARRFTNDRVLNTGNSGNFVADYDNRQNKFSIKWTGYIKIPEDTSCKFKFTSDDGFKFYIKDRKEDLHLTPETTDVTDSYIDQSPTDYYTDLYPAKIHDYYIPFIIKWYQNEGDKSFSVQWNLNNAVDESNNEIYDNVPDSALFR